MGEEFILKFDVYIDYGLPTQQKIGTAKDGIEVADLVLPKPTRKERRALKKWSKIHKGKTITINLRHPFKWRVIRKYAVTRGRIAKFFFPFKYWI